MKLLAKAASTVAEIDDKLKRGAEGIELQLLGKDDTFYDSAWIKYVGKATANSIYAVHTPLAQDPVIRHYAIDTPLGLNVFRDTCRRASELGDDIGRPLHVICHLAALKPELESLGLYDGLVKNLKSIANLFRNIIICIENSSYDCINYEGDNIELAEDVDMENVGVCVDTCHALIYEKAGQAMEALRPVSMTLSLDGMFLVAKDLCKHIHLCGAADTGAGYGRGTGHGTAFTGSNDKDLVRILDLIKRYTPNAMKVLEVWEDDYLDCVNYSKARKNILDAAAKAGLGHLA